MSFYRGNNQIIGNFLATLLAGYIVGQVFPIGAVFSVIGQNFETVFKQVQVRHR
jgi:hypothetical protein